ncbi:cytosolic carboxypeptidase 4 isoform X4 [Syngnathus typhle]|uniref:cytosolic carboxypeptidase 4 isoform X4 n=1 Tax=Syngnathus typhle TaxID=161592 RepID=UPI002A6A6759|nr:cytosolic carboxypeptidase 4 isoform X4 [Syngnathus typhle]
MSVSQNPSSGFEVIFSTLQNAEDAESTLNVLNILDELLSAGTDHRIHYMISKGGSEALLSALMKNGSRSSPDYTILLPILYLVAKVGQKDCHIGKKAEEAGAVLLTLNLLKNNIQHAGRAEAYLNVIQVFAGSAASRYALATSPCYSASSRQPQFPHQNILDQTKGWMSSTTLSLAIPSRIGKQLKDNICTAVTKGYVSGLLLLYDDWHSKDTNHSATDILQALLHCFCKIACSALGRDNLVSHGGIRLLYHTTQTYLLNKCQESLIESSVQLMRSCLPKTRLPLTSDQSAYLFPLPGRQHDDLDMVATSDESNGDDDDDDDDKVEDDYQEAQSKDYDNDLETDLNTLCLRPATDRPKELLLQYSRLCPELSHDFLEDLDLNSQESSSSSSSDDETGPEKKTPEFLSQTEKGTSDQTKSAPCPLKVKDFYSHTGINTRSGGTKTGETREEANSSLTDDEQKNKNEGNGKCYNSPMTDLIDIHNHDIPYHEPSMYRAAAMKTKSVPGFSTLAFPDFWGQVPPPGNEPMAPRKPNIQRQKVLEDIQRFLNTDIINQVVFDLEDECLQFPPAEPDSLRFFSSFECGNLRKAIRVRRYEYDLILNADANCSQHTQWFYFEVSNMVPDVPYRFNIINCEKSNSQFNYGMQPVLYSVRDALNGKPQWCRSGTEICYFRNHFCPVRGRLRTTFYTLTFTITFKYSEDVCYLAYHYPYTYSALRAHLRLLNRSVDPSKVFFREQVLCPTLAGNACPFVTITACPPSKSYTDIHQLRNRPCIVLSSRVHPGESNASWVMKGTLEFLCSHDPIAQALRETFVFKIIPMLNPDGVINGMNRCDLNRDDLNRQWCKPDPVLCPTIYHTKGFLSYLSSIRRTPLVFCDYHGHSRKKNVFLYGCSVKETLWQSGSTFDTAALKENPGYRVEKSRSATARIVVWKELGVLRSYTMESTFNGFDQGIYKGLQTRTRELEEMGMKFCHSLLSLTVDTRALYGRSLINHMNPGHNVLDHKSHNCFEDDEPPCVEEIEYSMFPGLKGKDLNWT